MKSSYDDYKMCDCDCKPYGKTKKIKKKHCAGIKKFKSAVQSKTKKNMKDERQPLLVSGEHYEPNETSNPLTPENAIVNMDSGSNVVGCGGEDYDPVLNRDLSHPTSNLDTLIHLLKGNIGTGILAMPDAFRNAGLAVGFFGTIIMGIICTHCMHMLVRCAHELCRRCRVPSMDFSEVVAASLETGPDCLRKHATTLKHVINIFLCITQLGFCCVYFVFVAANLHDVIKHYLIDLDMHWYLLMLLLPMIFLNWLKNLKYLTPVSLFAAILTVTGLVIIFFYMLQGLPPVSSVNEFSSWSQLPLFFGTVIYAFEGIGVVLPLENNMKTPQDFGGWNGVLNTGMVIVACLYTSVGFFGYLKYGDMATQGSITLYLPPNEILAQSVRLMMAVAIFLSYGLQFYVPMNIVWPMIREHLHTEKSQVIGEYVTRSVLVIVTFALAAAIPNLGAVISLVGAFSSSALALIFPPLIEIITFWPDRLGKHKWILWKDIAISLFGFAGFVVGSYVSVLNIIEPTV